MHVEKYDFAGINFRERQKNREIAKVYTNKLHYIAGSNKKLIRRLKKEGSIDHGMTWFVKQSKRFHLRRNGSTERELSVDMDRYGVLKGRT